jgi:glycerol kinase
LPAKDRFFFFIDLWLHPLWAGECPVAGDLGDQQAAFLARLVTNQGFQKHIWHRMLYAHEHRTAPVISKNVYLPLLATRSVMIRLYIV